MQHLTRNIVLILIILSVALLSIFPVKENLRLGKDLAGGVSLVYTVEVEPGDPPDTIERTIQVLKDRVDPSGLFEVSMVQQGADRIQISFPLPNQEVKELRAAYEQELEAIDEFSIDPDAYQRAMRKKGEERIAALQALIDGSDARAAVLNPVIEAAIAAEQARQDYDDLKSQDASAEDLEEMLNRATEAELAFDQATQELAASFVSADDVRAAMELSTRSPMVRDSATGKVIAVASPRERALNSIRERMEKLPGAEQALDEVIAAHAAYAAKRKGFDDPNEVIRLLQGAGVLQFRIAVEPGTLMPQEEARLRQELRERGPEFVQSSTSAWYPINKLENWYDSTDAFRALIDNPAGYFAANYNLIVEERDGIYYALLHDETGLRLTKAEGEWSVRTASQGTDQLGRPAVTFRMDPRGSRLLSQLTEPNVNRNMAVLLDNEIYTAPNILQRLSDNIQISGDFSQDELQYLIKTLNAGSLQARLSERPISQNTLAPSLGLDNLAKGLRAGWIGFVAVSVFMIIYYFMAGGVAVIALIANAIFILGAMSLARASFTLPGIAGVILTFGMAVDGNVLIYERIREEILAGNDLRTAVRLAYQKVFSTIMDANITNLIICFVLAYTGTPEIKGFAITLGIGIVGTLFATLIVTRVIFTVLVDKVKLTRMRQLPLVFPIIDRVLTPKIDFIKLRPLFAVISAVFIGTGLYMIFVQRAELLGTEFRGGTEVTLQLTEGAPPMDRAKVQERINGIISESQAALAQNSEDAEARVLTQLTDASVVPVNPEADGVTSKVFKVTTTISEDPNTSISEETVFRNAIVSAFSDVIESRPPRTFVGSESEAIDGAPVYQILHPVLGRNIGQENVTTPVDRFVGGVAIVIEDLNDPLPSRQALEQRLAYMRSQPDYSPTLKRPHELIVLEGSDSAVQSAVILSVDPGVSFFNDESRWRTDVAQTEWNLVRDALTESTTLAGVQSFSAAMAATFKAQAIVAVGLSFLLILIYIWVRFGSVRYSIAAIIALVHDVIAAVGLIAMAEILYKNFPGLAAINIQPYKIDLGLVAAILTIIGYSLNDTIIILDRVRENRGKLAYASRNVVNSAISQTISRTVITSGTTLIALIVMFVIGGEGIASFTYALICGIVVGTYSSIAIAAPLVYSKKIPPSASRYHTPDAQASEERALAATT